MTPDSKLRQQRQFRLPQLLMSIMMTGREKSVVAGYRRKSDSLV